MWVEFLSHYNSHILLFDSNLRRNSQRDHGRRRCLDVGPSVHRLCSLNPREMRNETLSCRSSEERVARPWPPGREPGGPSRPDYAAQQADVAN